MSDIGFAERLAYWRWLRSRGRLQAESDTEFAEAVGVGKKWLGKWKAKREAPKGRAEADAIRPELAKIGGTIQWLYDGAGDPPLPELWPGWVKDLRAARKAAPAIPEKGLIVARLNTIKTEPRTTKKPK